MRQISLVLRVFLLVTLLSIVLSGNAYGKRFFSTSEIISNYPIEASIPPIRNVSASDVLVVYNDNYSRDADQNGIQDSRQIAEYYMAARAIPEINKCPINTSSNEVISRAEFNSVNDTNEYFQNHIKQDLESCILQKNLTEKIKFIVLTKGVPLKINDSVNNTYSQQRFPNYDYGSIESELLTIFQETAFPNDKINNPYYDSQVNFFRNFPNTLYDGHRVEYISYLASRLDGYNVTQVIAMIDRGVNSRMDNQGQWVIDDDNDSLFTNFDVMPFAYSALVDLGLSEYISYNNVHAPILTRADTNNNAVIGYTHHGIYDNALGNNFIENGRVSFDIANGSIMMGYESFNGLSYDNASSTTHNLIADWIKIGGSGGVGNVYEPGFYGIPRDHILFGSYASGFSFIESAYQSLYYMDWTATIAGDPLMRINSEPEMSTHYFFDADTEIASSILQGDDIHALIVSYKNISHFNWTTYQGEDIVDIGSINVGDVCIAKVNITLNNLTEGNYRNILETFYTDGTNESMELNITVSWVPRVIAHDFPASFCSFYGNISANISVTDSFLWFFESVISPERYGSTHYFFSNRSGDYIINFTNITEGAQTLVVNAYDDDGQQNYTETPFYMQRTDCNDEPLDVIIPDDQMNSSINLSGRTREQLINISGLNFSNSFGTINYIEAITINRSADFSNQIIISNNSIFVNSTYAIEFNVSAVLGFHDVVMRYPVAYKDGMICDTECTNESYNSESDIFTFTVSGFSNYSLSDASCGDGVCNAAETCRTCDEDCGRCRGGGGGGDGSSGGFYPTVNSTNATAPVDDSVPVIINESARIESQNVSAEPMKPSVTENPSKQLQPDIILEENHGTTSAGLWIVLAVMAFGMLSLVSVLLKWEKRGVIEKPHVEAIAKVQRYYDSRKAAGKDIAYMIDELRKTGWTDAQLEYFFSKIKK